MYLVSFNFIHLPRLTKIIISYIYLSNIQEIVLHLPINLKILEFVRHLCLLQYIPRKLCSHRTDYYK